MSKSVMPSGASAVTTRDTVINDEPALGLAGVASSNRGHPSVDAFLDGGPGGVAAVELFHLCGREPAGDPVVVVERVDAAHISDAGAFAFGHVAKLRDE